MKQNDLSDITYELSPQNYEQIFNVYTDDVTGNTPFYFYNLLRTINIPANLSTSTYDTYTAKLNDTWPIIAWYSYQNVKLWWLVCATNQIINPLVQPVAGQELKILKPVYVRDILNNLT